MYNRQIIQTILCLILFGLWSQPILAGGESEFRFWLSGLEIKNLESPTPTVTVNETFELCANVESTGQMGFTEFLLQSSENVSLVDNVIKIGKVQNKSSNFIGCTSVTPNSKGEAFVKVISVVPYKNSLEEFYNMQIFNKVFSFDVKGQVFTGKIELPQFIGVGERGNITIRFIDKNGFIQRIEESANFEILSSKNIFISKTKKSIAAGSEYVEIPFIAEAEGQATFEFKSNSSELKFSETPDGDKYLTIIESTVIKSWNFFLLLTFPLLIAVFIILLVFLAIYLTYSRINNHRKKLKNTF